MGRFRPNQVSRFLKSKIQNPKSKIEPALGVLRRMEYSRSRHLDCKLVFITISENTRCDSHPQIQLTGSITVTRR